MYPRREVFPRSPLVYVTAEVALAYEPFINKVETRDRFADAIRDRLPILSQEMSVSLPLLQTSDDMPAQTLPALRAFNQDRTSSALLKATSLTFDTVAYTDFPAFLDCASAALTALAECAPQALVQRAGIRFVNELRQPHAQADDGFNWEKWVAPELLASAGLLSVGHPAGSMGHTLYHLDSDEWIGFRWGDVVGTSIIDRDVPLQRKESISGPFFALDIDSFWEPATPGPLDPDALLTHFRRLRPLAGELFQSAITDDAREYFRGEKT
ncbi:TIGR04255 family protein [Streptomyces sp. NBC_00076]|uniref:TIGR04255 family protein n=1 Tax=Streptomyces sp. NBC_00076 TaxID=2975642 RepID=UPI00324D6199